MKNHLHDLLKNALQQLQTQNQLPAELPTISIERTREVEHGDFATTIAMPLAKLARCKPRDMAQRIVDLLPPSPWIQRVEIAGPGFINFFLADAAYHQVVKTVLAQQEQFGCSTVGAGQTIQVEFVSANPTGPLHVGHGRGAAFGATVANLLAAMGFQVQREYYVNDAGRQMNILAASVWMRYLELNGEPIIFPTNAYKGTYVKDIAALLQQQVGTEYVIPAHTVLADLPPDAPQGGDKEDYIDALIERAKQLLGDMRYRAVFDLGLNHILEDIRDDLREFGVVYDNWYSERQLMERGAIDKVIHQLQQAGHLYHQEGALWFRSTAFGDEKDRVVQRDNGQTTYFASDIAYHVEKFERGFQRVIDIWGADHHGYVPRVKAALTALGIDSTKLDVLLVQFAILYRGGERAQMSTRSGEFVTLRDLRHDVGNDAARFFYIARKNDQHLDFDLDLAKSQSNDNPLYYIQYAHARICSVFRQAQERGLTIQMAQADLTQLTTSHEQALLKMLARYPEVIETAALNYEPHHVAHYLRELAYYFHTYYNSHTFLVEDHDVRTARLTLIAAVQQVIRNGLTLLGVSAPEVM